MSARARVDTSPTVADEVKTTTCYMCACRCGIKVHLRDGQIRYIEGNPDHPVNRGVLCAKGSAGIMQHYSPARLTGPLKRVGERGACAFQEISWDEALATATAWLARIRADDPRKLAFFTGRDQSQALTGWWASQFGTPNYAAHGGFCSVNMAAAGMYTLGGSFWEFGEPDWDRTRYFMLFGCAEDHDSNPIKIGLGRLKQRGVKIVSVNPVRTGYSAIADEWLGITPGTDGLLVLSLVHELLRAGAVDVDYLARYTNAGWLVAQNQGRPDYGLFLRDEEGRPLCWDRREHRLRPAEDAGARPSLKGEVQIARGRRALPVFHLMAERYLDARYSPDAVAPQTGIAAATIRRIAAELAQAAFRREIALEIPWTDAWGKRHERMLGRPVSMHAMRGISAHSNGFHTCRALHLLQALLGSIDVPGGWRFKPPYPKPVPPGLKPAGRPGEVAPNRPLPGPPLGFPAGPEDLLVEADGSPCRIDKAFSWEAPLAAHGMMHTVIGNAFHGDPYPIDTLFMYMANMAWNSAMDVGGTIEMLTAKDADGEYRIPRIIYADAYFSETVAYADLILPDTTYLERWDCISLLDRPISKAEGPADAIRQPVLAPDRDVRPFQDVLLDLGARLGLPGMLDQEGNPAFPKGYTDYLVHHERKPGIGSLAGWRGDGGEHGRGAPNPEQLQRYVENGCFWQGELSPDQRFFKHANRDYLDYAARMGFIDRAAPVTFQLYSEVLQKFRLAAQGIAGPPPPQAHRERIETYFDPLPFWYAPLDRGDEHLYPMHAVTQRPMAMYHSWGSQNAWLRQLHSSNRLYLGRERAAEMGLRDGDWVWVVSRHGRIKVQVRLMAGVNPDTCWTWNAIGKRAGAWHLAPQAPEATKGFLLNHLIDWLLPERGAGYRYANADPVTGQAAWYDLRVRVEKAQPEAAVSLPQLPVLATPCELPEAPAVLRYGRQFRPESRRP
ncbi:MAG TPA: molybdopterin oxidoreductase family protein [Geminicoccaceae bacterium]|nr:molybdopterin oxidoreductase family protein [Geminicoccaceae bacterium]